MIFQLSSSVCCDSIATSLTAFAVAPLPRHRPGDASPPLYADWFYFGCSSGATRHSCSSSTHRYSHSRTTRRHSHSRCCCRDRPHGLWEVPPFQGAKLLIFTHIAENFSKIDGLTPVFRCLRASGITLCRFAPAFSLYAHAASTIALYASTLAALTILPRKARRDPTNVLELDAS